MISIRKEKKPKKRYKNEIVINEIIMINKFEGKFTPFSSKKSKNCIYRQNNY